ncbi:hypothetical protein JIN84_12205 [Luteolibacter yonseiensis]|uniref:Sulfotransferase domain-containing protein n=1 Tax=Luteolibacter yonseiensis TaxID=1144680 RepID=A0A934VBR3_9BACT|nr:hypothetical protein [Luteolibacter yonseiensis]MBK1816380.1 hypothetical protein [Luteolibacter yonseiensis]
MEIAETKNLKPVVISSQRSGLNFLRVCIESLTGRRTPGKPLLVETGSPVFVRTHDSANISKKGEGSWKEIDDELVQGRKVVLLIRDPFEIYARELKIANPAAARFKLEIYISNLNHFCSLSGCEKRHFHYEDFTMAPEKMAEVIGFLGVPAGNGQKADEVGVRAEWDKMRQIGKDLYDINQKNAGGSMSLNAENRLGFHQATLSSVDRNFVAGHIHEKVSVAGRAILDRYLA